MYYRSSFLNRYTLGRSSHPVVFSLLLNEEFLEHKGVVAEIQAELKFAENYLIRLDGGL